MTKEEKKDISLYSKDAILKSKKYSDRKDLLNSLLNDNKKYSLKDIEEIIEKFMKGKVN